MDGYQGPERKKGWEAGIVRNGYQGPWIVRDGYQV